MDVADFTQQDLHKAFAEELCILDCLVRMQLGYRNGDYEKAKIAAENVARSFAELEKLRQRKITEDRLKNLIKKLDAEGVVAQVVVRYQA